MKGPVRVKEVPVILPPVILPVVLKEPAVTLLVTVNDLEMFKLPAKEEEPVPLTRRLPPIEA